MATASDEKAKRDAENLARFKKRAAELRREFDTEIKRILEDIRHRRLKQIREKMRA